jgi:hypothetical protein
MHVFYLTGTDIICVQVFFGYLLHISMRMSISTYFNQFQNLCPIVSIRSDLAHH